MPKEADVLLVGALKADPITDRGDGDVNGNCVRTLRSSNIEGRGLSRIDSPCGLA